MRVRFKFEPRDLWVGVYWTRTTGWPPERKRHSAEIANPGTRATIEVYVCPLPTLLMHVTIQRAIPKAWWQKEPEKDWYDENGQRKRQVHERA